MTVPVTEGMAAAPDSRSAPSMVVRRHSDAGLSPTASGNLQLVLLVDQSTPIPDGTGTFGALGLPSFDGTQLVFKGASADGRQAGVYRSDLSAALSRIVDQTTEYPLSPAELDFLRTLIPHPQPDPLTDPLNFNAFRLFEPPSISGSEIVFSGSYQQLNVGLLTGLFRVPPTDPVDRLVTTFFDTAAPNGPVLTNLARPSYSDGAAAFAAKSGTTFATGVYRRDAHGLVELASSATLLPGQTVTFDDFGFSGPGGTAIAGSAVAFVGRTLTAAPNIDGVYVSENGTLTRLADSTQRVPGTLQKFERGFLSVAGNSQQLCLLHADQGVFRRDGARIEPVVTAQTPLVSVPFLAFNTFAGVSVADAESVAVVGGFEFQNAFLQARLGRGLFLDQGQGLVCVVRAQDSLVIDLPFLGDPMTMTFGGDVLNGKTVADVGIAASGLSPTGAALSVQFTDNSTAIYAAIP
ncbi:MAG: hypothetical protein SFV23_22840 [Planctomycetaceae bacterium]|nr:hypothetical protein [Planctomycetaceae bacterium]